jgi:hypothetical protein
MKGAGGQAVEYQPLRVTSAPVNFSHRAYCKVDSIGYIAPKSKTTSFAGPSKDCSLRAQQVVLVTGPVDSSLNHVDNQWRLYRQQVCQCGLYIIDQVL